MFGLGMGKLGLTGGNRWTPAQLWPTGTEPGLWIAPNYVAASFQDSAGTTALSSIGSVADSANPVGLILDRKGAATTPAQPGIHLRQATSAARPVASARVNLLTKTEDFADANWMEVALSTGTCAKTPNYSLAPDGTTTACRVVATSPTAGGTGGLLRFSSLITALTTRKIWIKSNTGSPQLITLFATVTGASKTVTASWTEYEFTSATALQYLFEIGVYRAGGAYDTGVSCDISVWHPQIGYGTVAGDYQAVVSDSSYTASSIIYSKFDGVDDSWASATFPAGTLTSSMDCLIAVRRDSAANCVAGLYNAVADATKFFGMAESASGSGCVGSGAGTPTVWVDSVQLTGGTAVTRGTLHTALTAGVWHILEFRGLDLSTWTAAGFGLYTSYVLNGGPGGEGIMLFPSTTDAIRNKARTSLAASVGLVL